MFRFSRAASFLLAAPSIVSLASAQTYPRAGFKACRQTLAHGVLGKGTFLITGSQSINHNNGILVCGYGAQSTPFQGETSCIQTPLRRTAIQNAGGNASVHDCSGTYSYDFDARLPSGADPRLVTGRTVTARHDSRDLSSSFEIELSNGLALAITP